MAAKIDPMARALAARNAQQASQAPGHAPAKITPAFNSAAPPPRPHLTPVFNAAANPVKVSHPKPPQPVPRPPAIALGKGGMDRAASQQLKRQVTQRATSQIAAKGLSRGPAQKQGLANTPSIKPAFNKARGR